MIPVKVRTIEIGTGIPKICVPIVGVTQKEILKAAEEIRMSAADLTEWRADWYEDVFDREKTADTLCRLRDILGDMPLLFTFRTAAEGGEKEIGKEDYIALNRHAAQSGAADLIDAEMFMGDGTVRELIDTAHRYGVKVIVSNHDFKATPEKYEIVARLRKMQELGADIPKIAVMPRNAKDVLTLLAATEEMVSEHAECPVITMSMAGPGLISRLCGEIFGSAVTFGAVGKTSAPGQIDAGEMRKALNLLHRSM